MSGEHTDPFGKIALKIQYYASWLGSLLSCLHATAKNFMGPSPINDHKVTAYFLLTQMLPSW